MNVLIFIEKKEPYAVKVYGSLTAIYKHENMKKAIGTFYNTVDLDLEDYEDEDCRILQRSIIRSQHKQFL